MKSKTLLTLVMMAFTISVYGQSIAFTFTAIDNTTYIQLDSIKVMNRTQGDSAKLYWPDTTLTYEITPGDLLLFIGYATGSPIGVQEINVEKKQFQLFQNYPNPVYDQSVISMYIPEKGAVNVMVTDIQGRVVMATDWQLNKGNHSFRFTPGAGNLFFLTARWNGISRSIKILMTEPNTGKICMLDYIGSGNCEPQLKESSLRVGFMKESGILDSPTTNETYTFQFATNIPCPGTPTVTYDGQVYNTIQIFSQCWLKENLNVGTMIQGTEEMTDNGTIEKYCYNDEMDSCTIYGGLYQWDELMQYVTQQGAQGICPPGWHPPSDEEWKILEGAVDSLYGIGDPEWEGETVRGYDAGKNLKTTSGWYINFNGSDVFGFSGLPGGQNYRSEGNFSELGGVGYYWATTEFGGRAYDRRLLISPGIGRPWSNATWFLFHTKNTGLSVRCLRD